MRRAVQTRELLHRSMRILREGLEMKMQGDRENVGRHIRDFHSLLTRYQSRHHGSVLSSDIMSEFRLCSAPPASTVDRMSSSWRPPSFFLWDSHPPIPHSNRVEQFCRRRNSGQSANVGLPTPARYVDVVGRREAGWFLL